MTTPHHFERRGSVRCTRFHGFTLIEVMITVAIVAILAAVALPAYTDYIRKGKRATAQAALMDAASREQTYLLDRRDYAGSMSTLGFSPPKEIENDYTFDFPTVCARCFSVGATPPVFTIRATPSAALAAKGEQVLTVDDTGVKSPANAAGYWGK